MSTPTDNAPQATDEEIIASIGGYEYGWHDSDEAARDLYASGWQTFRHVIWPLSLPGVVAGTLLTFIPAAGDYINSRLLGNTNTVMIGQVIDSLFLRVLDYPQAAALSFILLLMIVTLVAVYVRKAGTEELV